MRNTSEVTREFSVVGTNITPEFVAAQSMRADSELVNESFRVTALRTKHNDGVRSSLNVSYAEIARNPACLDNVTPVSREPGSNGEVVLWQGYRNKTGGCFSIDKSDHGPFFQVVRLANGTRLYCKLNTLERAWEISSYKDEDGKVVTNAFPPAGKPRIKKSEDWQDVSPRTVMRTVLNANGKMERRRFPV